MTEIIYPATQVVHGPHGPINACDRHAEKAKKIMGVLGFHTVSTELEKPAECDNCVNGATSD